VFVVVAYLSFIFIYWGMAGWRRLGEGQITATDFLLGAGAMFVILFWLASPVIGGWLLGRYFRMRDQPPTVTA
jgi:hypothetical protein